MNISQFLGVIYTHTYTDQDEIWRRTQTYSRLLHTHFHRGPWKVSLLRSVTPHKKNLDL